MFVFGQLLLLLELFQFSVQLLQFGHLINIIMLGVRPSSFDNLMAILLAFVSLLVLNWSSFAIVILRLFSSMLLLLLLLSWLSIRVLSRERPSWRRCYIGWGVWSLAFLLFFALWNFNFREGLLFIDSKHEHIVA